MPEGSRRPGQLGEQEGCDSAVLPRFADPGRQQDVRGGAGGAPRRLGPGHQECFLPKRPDSPGATCFQGLSLLGTPTLPGSLLPQERARCSAEAQIEFPAVGGVSAGSGSRDEEDVYAPVISHPTSRATFIHAQCSLRNELRGSGPDCTLQ